MSIGADTTSSSTRPYLLRALHEWCTDNGLTPYVAVHVDASVQVPKEYVKNNEIVLNISYEAAQQIQLGNEFIEFKARFGGVVREIVVPVDHVVAIYARENGQGMAFPMPTASASEGAAADAGNPEKPTTPTAEPRGLRLATLETSRQSPSDRSADRPASPEESSAEEPEPPSEPPPSRPSLKRIK